MPYFVPASGFAQQVDEFKKKLAYLSDRGVEADDDMRSPIRATSYLVEMVDPGTGVNATFDYREEFRKATGGWLRTRYVYELRVSEGGGRSRTAHHLHDPWSFHQHCQTPGSDRDVHYADVEQLLQPIHELFVRQLAAHLPIDCSGLVPL